MRDARSAQYREIYTTIGTQNDIENAMPFARRVPECRHLLRIYYINNSILVESNVMTFKYKVSLYEMWTSSNILYKYYLFSYIYCLLLARLAFSSEFETVWMHVMFIGK